MKKILSLRVWLQAITGLMVLSLVATCAVYAHIAYQRQQAARRVLAVAGISRDLFTAIQELRLERGSVAVGLSRIAAPSAETMALVTTSRQRSRAALDSALGELSRGRLDDLVSDGPAVRRQIAVVNARRPAFERLRQDVDLAMRSPPSPRSEALREAWVAADNQLVEALGQLSELLVDEAIQTDPFIARMMVIKRLAWLERAAAGNDAMLFGQVRSRGTPLSPADRETFARLKGDLETTRQLLAMEAALASTPPRLKAAIAGAERRYYVQFRTVRDAALAELADDQRLVDRAVLDRTAVDGLKSLMDIADVAFELMEEHAAQEAAAAARQVYLALGLMALTCAFGLLSTLFIHHRVVRPMARIARSMEAVAAGDLESDIPFEHRGDEIGGLAQALGVFRRNALDKRLMEDALVRSQVAKEAAEAANQMKSQFLANMSHEIRTPLNGVLGMVQVMEGDELSPDQQARLDVIRDSGAALLQVLNDVLDISKIEAGKLDLSLGEFDIEDLAARTAATFAGAASAKGLALEVVVDPDAAGVWLGDADRIRQILSNLLSNAVKFTDAGAVHLRVEPRGEGLRLTVRDSGIGMSPQALPKLFSKFSQIDDSNERRFGGTGLGLAICRELVDLMGGEIEVSSAPGAGSAFQIDLPLPRVSRTPRARPAERPSDVGLLQDRRPRILAAEDNPTNRKVLAALLDPLGVDLTMVGDGRQAVAAWEGASFDLILMDIQMPEMGGVAAAAAIRCAEAERGLAPIPIVALSANAMSHQIAEYLAAGMTAYVSKPIDVGALYEALNTVLSPQAAAEIPAPAE